MGRAPGILSMAILPAPSPTETLTEYLGRFSSDDEKAAAVLEFRTKSFGMGVKILDEEKGLLGGYGIPFGGPIVDADHAAGKDLDGEYFDDTTNFCFDWFPHDNRPVLYDHGSDPDVKLGVIGRQVGKFVDAKLGVWVETQLDMANRYAKLILDLAKKGVLGYSSGALGGYVRREATGKITQWPWIEQTVTVRPANPYALIATDAVKHLEEAGLLKAPDAPPPASLGEALKRELVTDKKLTLPDGMSVDELRTQLELAIEAATKNDDAYVVDIRDGLVIAHLGDDWDEYTRFPFAIAADGTVKVTGAGEEVEQTTTYAVPSGKLTELAAKLEAEGWTRPVATSEEKTNSDDDQYPDLDTPEQKARRREIDELLATVRLERHQYA